MKPTREQIEDLQNQIENLDKVINIFKEKGEDPQPVVAAQESLKGRLAFLRGDLDSSKTAYRSGLKGFQKKGMDNEKAIFAFEAAQYFFEGNAPETAIDFCEEAVNAVSEMFWKMHLNDRLKVPEIAVRVYDLGIKIAYSQKKYDSVFKYIQMAKARWLLDVVFLKQIGKYLPDPGLHVNIEKWDRLLEPKRQNLHDALAVLYQKWCSYLTGEASEDELKEAEKQSLAAFQPLADLSFGPVKTEVSFSQIPHIQKRLASDEALLELFVQTEGIYTVLIKQKLFKFFYYEISAHDLRVGIQSTYVSLTQGENRRVFLKEIKDIEEADEQKTMEKVAKVVYHAPDENLAHGYDMVIKPIEGFLSDITRLIICPHWHLHIVPFHALFSSIKEGNFLIKSKAVTYCPSASIWERLKDMEEEPKSPLGAKSSAIIGVEKKLGSQQWARIKNFLGKLIGSAKISDFEAEAINIANQLKVTPILGASADKNTVLDRLSQADIIHLSCHSDLDHLPPVLNGLLLSDGILSLAVILTNDKLNHAHPSIISLSACRSGLGKLEPGDVFWGSGYGFLARMGCPVLSSLWPVDVEATRLLMEKFYEYGKDKKNWAEALQEAQCSLMKSFSQPDKNGQVISFADPYYWAGFFLLGS